ncbi:hypothetical protein PanWU01x14_253110 [Parasponia andersonii]|uniref:Uncharacterized protein n=1 Tax=Parasponia andersonii TaxID=3476 RepID=A0A2P5BBM5_PARAD|nr:hypothetical protein PanWU01x14_253110 [Parasponia andersonii]
MKRLRTDTWLYKADLKETTKTSVVTCLDLCERRELGVGLGFRKHTCRPTNVELPKTATYHLKSRPR